MTQLDLGQPDVAIHLDADGIIRKATVASAVFAGGADELLGRRWDETVDAPDAEKVRKMLESARSTGVTAFEQFTQRFPGGVEQPIEYATVRVDEAGGLLAIGKSVEMVTELQTRLVAAQQAMEQDYWKLREIETRYRLLFDASNEAVLLVNAKDHRIVEANPSAIRALGLAPVGREFIGELNPADRDGFRSMLERVREQGKAPATLVHIGSDRVRWMVRASLMTSDEDQEEVEPFYFITTTRLIGLVGEVGVEVHKVIENSDGESRVETTCQDDAGIDAFFRKWDDLWKPQLSEDSLQEAQNVAETASP